MTKGPKPGLSRTGHLKLQAMSKQNTSLAPRLPDLSFRGGVEEEEIAPEDEDMDHGITEPQRFPEIKATKPKKQEDSNTTSQVRNPKNSQKNIKNGQKMMLGINQSPQISKIQHPV